MKLLHRCVYLLLVLSNLAVAIRCVAAEPTLQPATQPSPTDDPASTIALPARENLHVYLLIGQSNMVGRDKTGIDRQIENPRVLAMNPDGKWVIAREPMHAGGSGIGPGISFAIEMLKVDPDVTIGLIPCAVGGSPLSRWLKGAEFYQKAIARVNAANKVGTLKGILWHQGESDSSKRANADSYGTRLATMLADLRMDLKAPDVPIVVGQLGDFLSSEKYPFAPTVRDAIRQMPKQLIGVGYADAAGLPDKGDRLHFSASAEQVMGAHFAAAMQEIQKPLAAPSNSRE
jgi:hypothetical protein